jgi:imidazoleglycerol-phosphate dehydratase/histidinol-phosphatase
MNRASRFERVTKETAISVEVRLDGRGTAKVSTGIGFFDHMLELLAKHSGIDLTIEASGDLRVDEHHTVEDVGLTLGEALSQALGKRRGIRRYGFLLPMDESLAQVAIDLGGRPYLVFDAKFQREVVGELPTELVEDFFKAMSDSLRANIHVNLHYGRNDHHKIEAIFKAFARALRTAIEADPRFEDEVPSTKGVIG